MRWAFSALVCLIAAAHFVFVFYLPTGGFLALALRRAHRPGWRLALMLHVAAAAWAVGSVTLNFWCPLTEAERWARGHAGMAPLGSAGFIDHYITGVLYPADASELARNLALTAAAASWVLLGVSHARRPPSVRGGRPHVGSDIMPGWASRHRSG